MATARSPAEEARSIFPDPQAEPRFWDLARWQQEEHEKQLAREAEFWRRMGRSGRRAVIFGSRAMNAITGGTPDYLQAGVQYATGIFPHQAMLAATGRAGHVAYGTEQLRQAAETQRHTEGLRSQEKVEEMRGATARDVTRMQGLTQLEVTGLTTLADIKKKQLELEMMGALKEDESKAMDFFINLMKLQIEQGGRVTPQNLLDMLDMSIKMDQMLKEARRRSRRPSGEGASQ